MTGTEAIRYLVIAAGLLVLGFNMSILVHAKEIVRAVWPWRVFIVGKTGMTVYVLVTLYRSLEDPVGALVMLATVSMVVTLISLVMLRRTYRLGRGRERRSL
jgi:drug/metabolite transporter (DMT)-like permease